MATPEELTESMRRIAEHPGHKIHLACQALNRTITAVFAPNSAELLALLDEAATDPMLAMELVQNCYRPDVRERFQATTIQRLHNYVAATMTLVEHTRRLMRDRTDKVAQEFARRKTCLLEHGEMSFVQDLRNFTLHRELPFLGHTVSMSNLNTPNQSMESEVELSVAALMEGDRWSSAAKTFLSSQGEVVVLRPVVRKHSELVLQLNIWLHDALVDANRAALAEVNKLITAHNALRFDVDFEAAERFTERWTREGMVPRPG